MKANINLTENEKELLARLINNPYADSTPFKNEAWAYNVLKGPADNATFGSLKRKGLVKSWMCDGDEVYLLTEAAQ
jgi:hypothetical protein